MSRSESEARVISTQCGTFGKRYLASSPALLRFGSHRPECRKIFMCADAQMVGIHCKGVILAVVAREVS